MRLPIRLTPTTAAPASSAGAGSTDRSTNGLAIRIRDAVLPFFLKRASSSNEWIHGYRVDWEEPIGPASRVA